jgi:hypothetical protein
MLAGDGEVLRMLVRHRTIIGKPTTGVGSRKIWKDLEMNTNVLKRRQIKKDRETEADKETGRRRLRAGESLLLRTWMTRLVKHDNILGDILGLPFLPSQLFRNRQ